MQYYATFLEGIITFVSPCLMPMLPIYVSYFAGDGLENKRARTIKNALGFILGFTIVFVSLGAFAGLIGSSLKKHQDIVNIITGGIVVLFGLNYMGVINIGFLNNVRASNKKKITGFFSSILFGIVFSIAWTPCASALLGSALMLASNQGTVLEGTLLLLSYSLGLAIPFLFCAVLIEEFKSAFDFIKKHYKTVTMISGVFLVIIGVLMMTGTMGRFLALLA